MAHDTLTCDEFVGGQTLSAWRDALLPDDEMRRIAIHSATCPACRERLADFDDVATALHRQVELVPDERILAGVRRRIAGRRRSRWPRLATAKAWSGLGALGSVAALLLLFVYVLNAGPGLRLPRGGVTATAAHLPKALATAKASPLASLTATAPVFSPSVSAQIAWGTTPPGTRTFTARVDATHVFAANGIMPDGHTLLGDLLTVAGDSTIAQTGAARAGIFDAATGQFTSIGVSAAGPYMPGCCDTDGRYVIATDYTQPGATCGLCHIRYWSYDTETGTLRQVAVGSQFEEIMGAVLSHGLLVFWTGQGIQVANLATHTVTPLNAASATLMQPILAFSWPYLVYSIEAADGTNSTRVRDMQTGKDETIPEPGTDRAPMAIAGNTLFAAVTSADSSETTLYQMDNFPSGAGTWHAIATTAGTVGDSGEANDRVVAFGVVAWDRAERRFVTFESSSGSGGVVGFSGHYLAVGSSATGATTSSLSGSQVIVYDTSTLPVRTGA